MKKQILLAGALCATMLASAENIDVKSFRYAGPYAVQQPYMVDSVDGIIFEGVTVLSRNPNITAVVGVKVVQVGELLDGFSFSDEWVMHILLTVVAVYPFMCQKPHVSFPVLLDGNNSTATQSVFRFQIAIELCRGINCPHT